MRTLIIMLLLIGGARAQGQVEELPALVLDEYESVATAVPAPRPLLPREQTADREHRILARLDRSIGDLRHGPSAGIRVVSVVGGGQADRLGVVAGDVLLTVAGVPTWTYPSFSTTTLVDDATVTWWAGDQQHVGRVRPGPFGTITTEFWSPEVSVLREAHPGPWDDAMLAAATSVEDDPQLAESELALAVADGYSGYLVNALLARAALAEGRFAVAISASLAALPAAPACERPAIARSAYAAALSSRRYDVARRLALRYRLSVDPAATDAALAAAAARIRARPDRATAEWDPFAGAAKPPLEDQTSHLTADRDDSAAAVRFFETTGVIPFATEGDCFAYLDLGPAAGDVVATGTITCAASDTIATDFPRTVSVAVIDHAAHDRELFAAALFADGRVRVRTRELPIDPVRLATPTGAGVDNRFRIAVIGDAFLVEVNGQRVFLGEAPDDPATRRLALRFMPVGMRGEIRDLTWSHVVAPAAGGPDF